MTNSIFLAVSSILSFIFSLLFSIGIVPMHAASPNDVVSTICQRARNPSFCLNILKSAGTTDLKGLATFTLNLAHTNATKSRALAQSLMLKATDIKLKKSYASCVEHYDNAAEDINDAKNYLASGDYNGVNIQASGAMTEADDCLDNFAQPPNDPSGMSKNAKVFEDICSIILVVANLLLGRV